MTYQWPFNVLPRDTHVRTLRERAAWHRAESVNFLRHSVAAMRQHELDAQDLERQANELELAGEVAA